MIDGYTQAQRFFFGWATLWRQNLTLGEAAFRLAARSSRARERARERGARRISQAMRTRSSAWPAIRCASGRVERIGVW